MDEEARKRQLSGLKPLNKRDPEEARRIQSLGGKASAEKRRARKTLAEELKALLSDGDLQKSMCLSLIQAASDGNASAFAILRDTIGEKPVDVLMQVQTDDVEARDAAFAKAMEALGLDRETEA